jgi:hypothetical protein
MGAAARGEGGNPPLINRLRRLRLNPWSESWVYGDRDVRWGDFHVNAVIVPHSNDCQQPL